MTISVVVINYNNGPYLRRAIDSVLAQTRLPDELVVSDDGSSDDSLDIVRAYMANYSFIRLYVNPVNLGASGNRDSAIRSSRSRFFINLDGDDWFKPDVVERTYNALVHNPESIVISSFEVCRDEESVITEVDTKPFCQFSRWRQLYILASRRKDMPGNQFALEKAHYLRLGGLDRRLRLYEDWDFLLRVVIKGVAWGHSECVGFSYRKSGAGLSSSSSAKHWKYKGIVIFKNAVRSRFHPAFCAGIAALVLFKGFKYLTGQATSYGYN